MAGGNACDNTEIYQEGLRLPPIKLFEQGLRNDAVWRILSKNVRVPDMVQGDVLAQVAAVQQGERDVLQLLDEYGIEDLKTYMTDIIDYTERLTRAEIDALPDGTWQFSDYVDDDGFSPDPIEIRVKVSIEGDEMLVDFTGTSPQAKGSINPNLPFTKSAVYAVFKSLTNPDITANAGFFRPFHVVAPPGCYVNPQHPAPVAARGLGGFRVSHAVFGAMSKALPDRVPAAWGGGEVGISFGGYDPDGKAFVFVEFDNDGPRGGGPFADGADGASAPIHNMANTPIESIEANHPLLVRRYGFIPDTAGAGEYRGGLGMVREFELLHDEATLQIRSDRAKFLPWGTQGGSPGSRSFNVLNPGLRQPGPTGQVPAYSPQGRRVPSHPARRRRIRRPSGAGPRGRPSRRRPAQGYAGARQGCLRRRLGLGVGRSGCGRDDCAARAHGCQARPSSDRARGSGGVRGVPGRRAARLVRSGLAYPAPVRPPP